jgi:Polyketide cyclase / dehydrase and lipid transport
MTTTQQERRRDTSEGNGAAPDRGGQLKDEVQNLLGELAELGVVAARDAIGGATERLTDYVQQGGGPGLMAAVTGAKSMAEGKSPMRSVLSAGWAGLKQKLGGGGKGGKGGQGKGLKVTNIVESIDVGVPVRMAYNQWTQFADFPSFMKKVEGVNQEEDNKLSWKAQIFWSHRSWESTIIKQIPDERIVWRSEGAKGHVDGAVSFHEIGPNLTRILLVLEYHPQGFFEGTGNLWRAQGRRARLELKHFRRHVMTQTVLRPDELEGWRGVIEDGEVVQDHESRLREEQGEEQGEEEPEARDQEQDYADEDYADEDSGYGDEEDEEPEAKAEQDAGDEYTEDYPDEDAEEPADEAEEPAEEEAEERPVRRGRRR